MTKLTDDRLRELVDGPVGGIEILKHFPEWGRRLMAILEWKK